jgi:hypothetical protein
MQQRYQPTPTNLMHITLDSKCNKAFIKIEEWLYVRGLPALQRWLVLIEVKFDTNTTGGLLSPKLDRHDPNTLVSTTRIKMMRCLI